MCLRTYVCTVRIAGKFGRGKFGESSMICQNKTIQISKLAVEFKLIDGQPFDRNVATYVSLQIINDSPIEYIAIKLSYRLRCPTNLYFGQSLLIDK